LVRERDELRQKLSQTSEAALERLRRGVADRRASLSELDRLYLDESVPLEEIVLKQVRAALPDTPGVELSLKPGRRGFEVWLDLTQLQPVEAGSEGPRETDFGPLAEALSAFPSKQLRHWLENLYLDRAGAHRYPQRFLRLSPAAWQELFRGYLRPHETPSATYIDNLYGKRANPKLSQLNVTLHESAGGPHQLVIVGPQRVEGSVEPGKTFSCELEAGAYVIRSEGPSPEDTIYLHLVKFGPRRSVKFTLEPRK